MRVAFSGLVSTGLILAVGVKSKVGNESKGVNMDILLLANLQNYLKR